MQLKFENLSSDLTERGESKKIIIADLGDYKVEILQLAPFAKVKSHGHYEEWELMIDIDSKEKSICNLKESHAPKNPTNVVKRILCIKGKKEKELPQVEGMNSVKLDSYIVELKECNAGINTIKNNIGWEIRYCLETNEAVLYLPGERAVERIGKGDKDKKTYHFISIKALNKGAKTPNGY